MIGEKVEVETPSEQAVEGESSAAELEVDEAPDTQANGTDTSHEKDTSNVLDGGESSSDTDVETPVADLPSTDDSADVDVDADADADVAGSAPGQNDASGSSPQTPQQPAATTAQSNISAGYSGGFPPLAKYKLVFLGDLGVGKTSIITRFMFDSFETAYVATIGIDFLSKTMHLDDRTIRLQLWDTAGQERFRSLIPSYIRDSSVAVIVYDITKRATFMNSRKWIEDARNERNNDIVIMLVGNKTDKVEEREVTLEEGEGLAKDCGVLFIETSAKQGYNVKALFKRLANSLPGLENNPANSGIERTVDTAVKPKLNLAPTELQEGNCAC